MYTLDDLKLATSNKEVKTINLKASINDINETITFANPVTFNGESNTLTFTVTGQNLVFLKPSIVNDLEIVSNGTDKWTSTYAMQVYNGTGYAINGCKCSGANAALLVNGASATVNNCDVSQNTFGGIEVSKGKAASKASTLTITGSITNTTEEYGKPTIWIDGGADGNKVNATGLFSSNTIKADQVQYYIVESNMSE